MEYLVKHIPSSPAKRTLNPFSPPRPAHSAFKEIILDMIMKNGTLPLWNMEDERLRLVQVLVEKNFLRWSHAKPSPETSTNSFEMEPIPMENDFFMRKGDTELVWHSRLVADVCENWFNNTM